MEDLEERSFPDLKCEQFEKILPLSATVMMKCLTHTLSMLNYVCCITHFYSKGTKDKNLALA